MKEIRSSQIQPPSSASSAADYELLDDLVSASTAIDELVIAYQILGVR